MELSDVQKAAIVHIMYSFAHVNPICALDMGEGKTRVACEIIKEFRMMNKKILIIHKAANIDRWIEELSYYGFDPPLYIHGKNRHKYLYRDKYHFSQNNLLLTSYETARIDIDNGFYDTSISFDLIIFDELYLIINFKKPTKKYSSLSLLQGKHKLALTGTPVQNSQNDLGLLFLFLNRDDLLSKFNSVSDNIDTLSKDANNNIWEDNGKKALKNKKENILETAVDLCIEENALFFHFEEKKGFKKYTSILYLPIDEKMHAFVTGELTGHSRHIQIKYLSHPASIYRNSGKDEMLPRCTKAEAALLILKSMSKDDKAIIFS
jgi:hypothetical protein